MDADSLENPSLPGLNAQLQREVGRKSIPDGFLADKQSGVGVLNGLDGVKARRPDSSVHSEGSDSRRALDRITTNTSSLSL